MTWLKEENIAQVEFLHLGNGNSLESIYRDAFGRVEEDFDLARAGSKRRFSGKTVVRFRDECGSLTALALISKHLRGRERYIHTHFEQSRGLRRWLLNRESRRVARKSLALRDKVLAQALRQLRQIVRSVGTLAVELSDNSFRPVVSEEAHELLESAKAAYAAQLFVFEPNDLLADVNKGIAAMV